MAHQQNNWDPLDGQNSSGDEKNGWNNENDAEVKGHFDVLRYMIEGRRSVEDIRSYLMDLSMYDRQFTYGMMDNQDRTLVELSMAYYQPGLLSLIMKEYPIDLSVRTVYDWTQWFFAPYQSAEPIPIEPFFESMKEFVRGLYDLVQQHNEDESSYEDPIDLRYILSEWLQTVYLHPRYTHVAVDGGAAAVTPLHLVQYLVEHGASLHELLYQAVESMQDDDGETLEQIWAIPGVPETINEYRYGETLLCLFLGREDARSDYAAPLWLLEHGADPRLPNHFTDTGNRHTALYIFLQNFVIGEREGDLVLPLSRKTFDMDESTSIQLFRTVLSALIDAAHPNSLSPLQRIYLTQKESAEYTDDDAYSLPLYELFNNPTFTEFKGALRPFLEMYLSLFPEHTESIHEVILSDTGDRQYGLMSCLVIGLGSTVNADPTDEGQFDFIDCMIYVYRMYGASFLYHNALEGILPILFAIYPQAVAQYDYAADIEWPDLDTFDPTPECLIHMLLDLVRPGGTLHDEANEKVCGVSHKYLTEIIAWMFTPVHLLPPNTMARPSEPEALPVGAPVAVREAHERAMARYKIDQAYWETYYGPDAEANVHDLIEYQCNLWWHMRREGSYYQTSMDEPSRRALVRLFGSAFYNALPQGSDVFSTGGPLFAHHDHDESDPEYGVISTRGMLKYLMEDNLRMLPVDKFIRGFPCYVMGCEEYLTAADVATVAPAAFMERRVPDLPNPDDQILLGLDQSIELYDELLTDTLQWDPSGVWGFVYRQGICPFCIQPVTRVTGCGIMEHARTADSIPAYPFCIRSMCNTQLLNTFYTIARDVAQRQAAMEGFQYIPGGEKIQFCITCGDPTLGHYHFANDEYPAKPITALRVQPPTPDLDEQGRPRLDAQGQPMLRVQYGQCPGRGRKGVIARALMIRQIYASLPRHGRTPQEERMIGSEAAMNAAAGFLELAETALAEKKWPAALPDIPRPEEIVYRDPAYEVVYAARKRAAEARAKAASNHTRNLFEEKVDSSAANEVPAANEVHAAAAAANEVHEANDPAWAELNNMERNAERRTRRQIRMTTDQQVAEEERKIQAEGIAWANPEMVAAASYRGSAITLSLDYDEKVAMRKMSAKEKAERERAVYVLRDKAKEHHAAIDESMEADEHVIFTKLGLPYPPGDSDNNSVNRNENQENQAENQEENQNNRGIFAGLFNQGNQAAQGAPQQGGRRWCTRRRLPKQKTTMKRQGKKKMTRGHLKKTKTTRRHGRNGMKTKKRA